MDKSIEDLYTVVRSINKFTPFILTLYFLLLIGCSDTENQAPLNKSTVFRYSFDGNVDSMDPLKAGTSYTAPVVNNIFDTLYAYKYLAEPVEIKPNLASSLPEVSEDLLTYTFRMKKGVVFQDSVAFKDGKGREVVANDFVYSLKRHFDPNNVSTGKWLWKDRILGLDEWAAAGADYESSVAGLKAIDDYTVQITLKRPFPQLINTLTMPYSAVVPKEAVLHFGQSFGRNPVGSGPFSFVSMDSTMIKLKRNQNYRNEPVDLSAEGFDESVHGPYGIKAIDGQSPPFVDFFEVHFIKESSARWLSLNKPDEIDFAVLPKELYPTVLAGSDSLQLNDEYKSRFDSKVDMKLGLVFVGFNMNDPEIGFNDNPERNEQNRILRCAIKSAYDWKMVNRSSYQNTGLIFNGVIPPGVPEYLVGAVDDVNRNNPDHHISKMAGAGWNKDNLPDLTYHHLGNVIHNRFFDLFRGFLSKINYPTDKVNSKKYGSFAEFNESIRNHKAQIFYMEWSLDYPDVENSMQLFYGPNESPGSNFFNYRNQMYDQMFEEVAYQMPSDYRTAVFQEMNRLVEQDCPIISGMSRQRILVWDNTWNYYPASTILAGSDWKYIQKSQN